MTIRRTTSTQQCPICHAVAPLTAAECPVCGAALTGAIRRPVRPAPDDIAQIAAPRAGNSDVGENDLYEGALPAFPVRGVLMLAVVLLAIGGGAAFFIQRSAAAPPIEPTSEAVVFFTTVTPIPGSPDASAMTAIAAAPSGTATQPAKPTAPPTNTRPPSLTPTDTPFVALPTLDMPTVTTIPPSATLTPTRGPCIQKAKQGDTLSALMARCGIYSSAALPVVLELNNMSSPSVLQVGQSIQIPWPTATGAPVAAAVGSGTPLAVNARDVEPTLIPGQAWHTVKAGENAITIAYKYGATIKILHDLNPEINAAFSQCDYGQPAGGQDCTVSLSVGQRLRVPVPTPTPTLTFTPNGSETPTPTYTPTYNAPYIIGPGNNMLFDAGDFPVLRWSASDRLSKGQVYLIVLKDRTINKTYRIPTKDLFYPLTPDVQPNDGKRHEFEWMVGVAVENGGIIPDLTQFITETRTFVWQGR